MKPNEATNGRAAPSPANRIASAWAKLQHTRDDYPGDPLAPESLDGFVGQRRALEQIHFAIKAARHEGRATDHMLITGASGTGKTTLARLVAREQDSLYIFERGAPTYTAERLHDDLHTLVNAPKHPSSLILEEVHAATPRLRDSFIVALDDLAARRTHRLVTVVALTNKAVPDAVRRRFQNQIDLGQATEDDLTAVVLLFAQRSRTPCNKHAARLIGKVALTPGQAKNIFTQARQRAVADDRMIDEVLVGETLATLGIQPETGLDDRQISALRYLCAVGSASSRSVSAAMGVDPAVYESLEQALRTGRKTTSAFLIYQYPCGVSV